MPREDEQVELRKVLFFSGMSSRKYGSLEKWFLLLAENLKKKNIKFSIHYNGATTNSDYIRKLDEWNVDVLTQHPPPGSVAQIAFFRKIIRAVNPSVVHALFSSKPLYSAFLAGVPKIYWTNALEMPERKWSHPVSFKVIDRMCSIFSASDSVREQMIRAGFRQSNVRTLYFGLPVEHMDFSTRTMPAVAGSLWAGAKLRICCISHYRTVKGVDLLLRAFKEVIAEVPEARLLHAGVNIDEHDEFRKLSEGMGLERYVHWVGVIDDAYRLIQHCDVYVQPSRKEALGFTVLEAAYQEKPVVAFRVGGIPEVIEHGYNGLLAEPENVSELACYIVTLAKDAEKRELMGRKGKIKAATLLSRDRVKDLVDSYCS